MEEFKWKISKILEDNDIYCCYYYYCLDCGYYWRQVVLVLWVVIRLTILLPQLPV